jgi:hypothetical protein
MQVLEVVPGLYRWTAPHPDWKPGEGWDEEVGCVLYELPDTVALFDPLLPREGREEALQWLDQTIAGRSVSILTTIRWHARDRRELALRYRPQTRNAWNAVPAGVVPHWLRGAGEIVFWLPAVATLIPGDSLLGTGDGGLRLCPESWLKDEHTDLRGLAARLEDLLELPIVRVLVSHGEPVLHDGRAALLHAIERVRETQRA